MTSTCQPKINFRILFEMLHYRYHPKKLLKLLVLSGKDFFKQSLEKQNYGPLIMHYLLHLTIIDVRKNLCSGITPKLINLLPLSLA